MKRAGQHGINSIEVGMRLLDALTTSHGDMTLSALAAGAAIHPSKAHRYLVSLIRAGYVAQDSSTGRYGIGPQSTALGLAAMRRLDVARMGADLMNELRDATGQTISMVMWANQGPTIVSVREADTPIVVTVRVGSVLPLLSSANGPLFVAYLPRAKTKPFVEAELVKLARTSGWKGPRTIAAVERRLLDIRRRRMCRSDGTVSVGVVSLAAPVFDNRGEIACSIALVGSRGNLSLSWHAPPAKLLIEAAETLSQRLGWSPPERRSATHRS